MPIGRPKTFDEDATLDAAIDILWREGVRGVSLNELAARTGTSKPALARAFGGKDALTARALERYHGRTAPQAERALAGPGSAVDVARRYLDVFVEAHTGECTPPGCLLASATSDCAAVRDGPVRETIDRLSARNQGALRARLAEAGVADPDALARFLAGQTLAMSALARNGATREQLRKFADLALRAVPQ